MDDLVFGDKKKFYCSAQLWELQVILEIGDTEDGHFSCQSWFLDEEEIRKLRDWLTEALDDE